MSVNSVIVRMYRHLLGDCFLIIVENDGKYSKTLVDCGILQGTPSGDLRMCDVVGNVYGSFGKDLDLVVVTHEHWDHISGFQHAAGTFGRKKFGNLWMAWTDDPKDPDGLALQARFSKGHSKLSALAAVTGRPLRAESDGQSVGLMGFAGPLAAAKRNGALRGSKAIYENLRSWSKGEPKYLSPGMIDVLPGNLKTYVLAPPKDTKLLLKALPSSGDKETYLGANPDNEELNEAQAQSPFTPRYRWRSVKQINKANRTGSSEKWVRDRYFGTADGELDRRIDDRYDLEFNRLAIRMDSNTNNSSLVLAIELPDGSTMIFAADAQVGNWLSWKDVSFKEKDANGEERLTKGHDLVGRARLYKVGHHGSHNATLKKDGLELMVRDDLVALISTDAKFALQQGKGWLMPNPNVSKALDKHAPGRVVRGDMVTKADQKQLATIVKEGKDELYVDVLAYGDWPADYNNQNP